MVARICHVITRLDIGGAQETALRMCDELQRAGHSTALLSGGDEGFGGSMAADAAAAGIPVTIIPRLHGAVGPADVVAFHQLRREIRRVSPHIVHTHSSKAGVIGRAAARSLGIPVVHTVHGWSFHQHQRSLVSRSIVALERGLAHWTDALVVVTDVDREVGLRYRIGSPESYRLIRSGIDFQGLQAPPGDVARLRMEWGEDVVLFVGRLGRQKDPLTLVRGFAIARHRLGRGRLVLAGDGPLRDEVSSEIERLRLSESVQLLGVRRDVPTILRAADMLVLPSRWEGLPRTVVEAMAVGLPVVATDVGGTGEVLRDGVTGIVIPQEDPDAVAQAIIRLWDEPGLGLRLARAATAVVEPFSQRAMGEQLQELYAEVLGRTL